MARKSAPKSIRISFDLAHGAMHSIGQNAWEQKSKGYLFTAARMFRQAAEIAALIKHDHLGMWVAEADDTLAQARAKDALVLAEQAAVQAQADVDALWSFGTPVVEG
jgi:hypothetical protein